MTLTPEHELWAVALWVEKEHGINGPEHIAEQVTRLAEAGDFDGVKLWRAVADRYDSLSADRGDFRPS